MKLNELADVIGVDIVLRRYNNQDERWTAKFEHAEIGKNGCLISTYGGGVSPQEALDNYVNQIRGELLVLNAYGKDRKEFNVPLNLEV